ncbi:rRNA Methylase family protein [Desulfonema magnum]|uniref:Putative tRNA (cytidine(34)-2'-O)-methyltransferase n=2 Tax=Desulfonema magnum TaxID=45655 RepID=A0A975BPX3_9BACT|nr:rRNA Methylase family protein [Desulfonema magnum]
MKNKFEKNTRVTERHVVLIAPEVHWNTGNIGRTCLGAGAFLHLIRPLGFSLESKQVKRAGLDYWPKVRLFVWENFEEFKENMRPKKEEVALFAKKAEKPFWSMPCPDRLFLIFGSETKGLPETILSVYNQAAYHIPISGKIRCLNLSTAVGIALYESLRSLPPVHAWAS